MKKRVGSQVLTGNALMSGDVIFWTGDDWSTALSDACVMEDADEQDAALAAASTREDVVVGPYLAAIDPESGAPSRLREVIRTRGPSIEFGRTPATAA